MIKLAVIASQRGVCVAEELDCSTAVAALILLKDVCLS
jgi:hypothetical protein